MNSFNNVKKKEFPVDLFKRDVIVVIGDEDFLIESSKEYDFEEEVRNMMEGPNGNYDASTLKMSTGDCFIFLKEEPKDPFGIGLLAHEIVHASIHILKSVDIEINSRDDEVLAYLVENLVYRVMKWLNED